MKLKFFAFYLPQFHVIKENNIWWGENYTEWERLKRAKPLFKDHYQPKLPYHYYDLSKIDTLKEQVYIAKKFGIDGFCFYHYWFNGKLLLEKPAEMLLENKDLNIEFCFSWANESWTRSWDNKPKEILIKQEYGDKNNWKKHLEYLVKFFKDKRYLKIENAPIFLIYRTNLFKKFDEMIEFWNNEIKKYGFEKIFIVETLNSYQKKPSCKNSNAIVEFEPLYTINYFTNPYLKAFFSKIIRLINLRTYRIIDYDKIWKRIIKRNKKYNNKIRFLGAFTDWDNSPRYKEKAIIFKGSNPKKFEYYLFKQTQKLNLSKNIEDTQIIFINAWNEWTEGAYLEPCKKWKYGYLKAIKNIKDKLIKYENGNFYS